MPPRNIRGKIMKKYDYLIVGSGLFGAVFAYEAKKRGKECLVIEKRNHIGGNIYCENVNGINVHKYGAHIFHTSNKAVWDYINQFAEFNNYINSPVAVYKDELYNLPFNMNTFSKTVSPSFRISYMVLPEELSKTFNQQLGFYSCTVPTYIQLVLAKLITNGDFERHINRVRRLKRKQLKESIT